MRQKITKRNKIKQQKRISTHSARKAHCQEANAKTNNKTNANHTKTHRMLVTASTSYVVNKIMICLTEPEIYESLYVTEAHQHTWHTTVRRSA